MQWDAILDYVQVGDLVVLKEILRVGWMVVGWEKVLVAWRVPFSAVGMEYDSVGVTAAWMV